MSNAATNTSITDPCILAIETSGSVGSVAVARGGQWLADATLAESARHAGDLLPAIDRLFRGQGWRPGDLSLCCVSVGPGSFTGLRIGVTVARHLALAVNARIVAVPSLDVIAEHARSAATVGGHIAVMLNARSEWVFGAIYRCEAETLVPLSPARMVRRSELLAACPRPCVATGEGIRLHEHVIEQAGIAMVPDELRHPRATDVHRLGWARAQRGEFTAPQDLVPLYIRRPEAEEVWDRREAGTTGVKT